MRNAKGITLITLIVVIIIMLIVSGIVINLGLGENGLFSKVKYASTKTDEQMAREKLELVLLELQADKINSTSYNEKQYINTYISNNNMTIDDTIVYVNEWRFQIDRTKLQIITNLGKGEPIIITAPYIGTSSFTVQLSSIPNENEVESYSYVIDNTIAVENLEKSYTQNEQESETMHTAKVMVKYKNGKTKQSNVLNIKLAPRTYLYNEEDECIDITGGWNGYI